MRSCLCLCLGVLPSVARAADFATERVAAGMALPIFAEAAPGHPDTLYIGEQHTGRIFALDLASGVLANDPFLDIDGLATGFEQGLLGVAFHPEHASNREFFVYVTVTGGDTEVRRYTRSLADPALADPGSTTVITWDQPQANHNGGWIGFGPDGFLYIASGDGGSGHDNGTGHTAGTGNAQDITNNRLGKILRIDVDGDDFPADPLANYAIPADNPFVGVTGDDEIWVYGLRNPYRACFDRVTGDLFIGDVGQFTREEIDVVPAGSDGLNFEWRLREGTIATPTGGVGGAKPPGGIEPIYEYGHGSGAFEGEAVIGGCVYRGPVQSLRGLYIFADNFSSSPTTARIWALRFDGSDPASFDGTNFGELEDLLARPELSPDAGSFGSIGSFGEDAAGNLYILDLGGDVFRLTGTTSVPLAGAPVAWLLALASGGLALAAVLRSRR